MIAGPLALGILSGLGGSNGWHGWQWLFLIGALLSSTIRSHTLTGIRGGDDHRGRHLRLFLPSLAAYGWGKVLGVLPFHQGRCANTS